MRKVRYLKHDNRFSTWDPVDLGEALSREVLAGEALAYGRTPKPDWVPEPGDMVQPKGPASERDLSQKHRPSVVIHVSIDFANDEPEETPDEYWVDVMDHQGVITEHKLVWWEPVTGEPSPGQLGILFRFGDILTKLVSADEGTTP